MKTPELTNLISGCWASAEQTLRFAIKQEHPDVDEEDVTLLLRGKLRLEFDRVNANGGVERAFLRDLQLFFPRLENSDLSKISSGLVASVHFHPKKREGKTGGDLGIVLIRPDVRQARFSGSDLTINRDRRRGLLCQAKIFRRDSSWGRLSTNQIKVLRERLDYFALLLYRYDDQSSTRRELAPFQWQLTREASIRNIQAWLASDKFPSPEGSAQIIKELAMDQIGTDDGKIIEECIDSPARPALTIKLGWREGDGPAETIRILEKTRSQQVQVLYNFN